MREAESIKVAAFPEPPAFRSWKSSLRQEVAAASGRPDEAFVWFQATDRLSFAELASPGVFPTLDTKLGAGVQKAARGELARQITLVEETEAKAGRLLKGRQILKMVYESDKLDEAIGQVFDIENVCSTTLNGDNLAMFLLGWDSVLAGQPEPIS